MQGDYVTVAGFAEDEFVEKKSRFIGHSKHVETEAEALAFVAEISKKYWDATHNVYAFSLRDGMTRRYSDDGEPQGTAGVPVLDVILKEGVVDVCVVVTRYFGGILLGGGGLVRAYSQGARIALAAAEKLHMTTCRLLEMALDYSLYGKLTYMLPQYGVEVTGTDFTDLVTLRLKIRADRQAAFEKALTELTGGKVVAETVEEFFGDMP
ncbi:MAG: YigZ family protein [Oscillospiraceae bacterium]|jgi:uncharacterized YigZ family protein|nr:YigZ family protein [Oscillospiraceae bacterium]